LHLAATRLLLKLVVWTCRAIIRSRHTLVLENLALRQQLATLAHRRRPRLDRADRLFWIALRAVWTEWAATLAIVKPATVVAWHRRSASCFRDSI
jgi:putative transposase